MEVDQATSTTQDTTTQDTTQEMWVDKYRPMKVEDLVGNEDNIEAMRDWFKAYKNKDPTIKRALLLVGPPGTGKTTSSKVIAEEEGYKTMEFNASDCRNKKSIQTIVAESSKCTNISKLYLGGGEYKPHVIVMDEVDGMSRGDRGGLKELIKVINPLKEKRTVDKKKKDRIKNQWFAPIVCIANTDHLSKLKNLITQCYMLSFDVISDEDMRKLFEKVVTNEGLRFETVEIEDLIITHAQGDCRRLLHTLETINRKSKLVYSLEDVESVLKMFEIKKRDISIHQTIELLIDKGTDDIDRINQIFNMDRSLVPLMVQENYLRLKYEDDKIASKSDKCGDVTKKKKLLSTLSECSDLISLSDNISFLIFQLPVWSLYPLFGVVCVYCPLYLLKKLKYMNPKEFKYTQHLGCVSTNSAQKKILSSIGEFNLKFVDRDNIMILKNYVFYLIENDEIDKLIETLYHYEMVPSVLEILLRVQEINVDKKVHIYKKFKKIVNAKFRNSLEERFRQYEEKMFKTKGLIPISERHDTRREMSYMWDKKKDCYVPDKIKLNQY